MSETMKTSPKSGMALRLLRYSLPYWRSMLLSLVLIVCLTRVAPLWRWSTNGVSVIVHCDWSRWQNHLLSSLCTELATELVFERKRRSIGPLIESGRLFLCWLSFELSHTVSTVRDFHL